MSNYYKLLEIPLIKLIEVAHLPNQSINNYLYIFNTANKENIHKIFKYQKFNDNFTDYLTIYNNSEDIVGIIKPSYDEFLNKLIQLLNIKNNNSEDNYQLTKLLNERIAILKNITTIKELKKEFPLICRDYGKGLDYIEQIETEEKEKTEDQEILNESKKYYYSCGMRRNINNFIKTQSEVYERFINRRLDYKKEIESLSYNNLIRNIFDINKVIMYIIHEYLIKCELSNDLNEIKLYLSLVKKYQSSNYDKTTDIIIDNNKIDINNINERVKIIEKRIFNTTKVDWIMVPSKTQEKKEYKETLTTKEIERLKKIGNSKKQFYNHTNYTLKVIDNEEKYNAYIYPNGIVILDYEYHSNDPKTAIGNAIYIMNSTNFEWFSKLDKDTLQNNVAVKRIIHSKNWQTKVKELIEQPGNPEEIEYTKILVKQLKEKE